MPRTLEVFEHGSLYVSDAAEGMRPDEFDALVRFNDANEGAYFDVGHKRIKFKNFVGYIEIGSLSIEILPKADRAAPTPAKVWRDGLREMLQIAYGLRLEQPSTASQKLARLRLVDLVAQAYLAELEPLLHHGLAKGYRTIESNGAVFRGRLRISEHLRENTARRDRFFVEYQTFDNDIAVNRLLAAALEAISWSALSPSVASRVDACLSRFPEVQIGGVTAALFDRIRLGRTTQRYAAALVYARMILAQQGPHLRAGRERVFALLFDMNILWERFAAALFRRAAPTGIHVTTQEHHDFWLTTKRPRKVKPDVVLRVSSGAGKQKGKVLLVIDTKWKLPSNGQPSDEDLKQMFVYNELLESEQSMLLYPATASSKALSGTYAKKAHGCKLVYLGLMDAAGWSTRAMGAELKSLMAGLMPSSACSPSPSLAEAADHIDSEL